MKLRPDTQTLVIFGIPEQSDSNEGSPRDLDVKTAGNIIEVLVEEKIHLTFATALARKRKRKSQDQFL